MPRPAFLGALLLTDYLGGAVESHLPVGSPLYGDTLVGVDLGVMAWSGLWLRDGRVRALLPVSVADFVAASLGRLYAMQVRMTA